MADYVFTQNGDNNVQIGDMTGMPYHVNTALKWALEHNFQSVAAQYSRTLALEVVRLREDSERTLKLTQARVRGFEADLADIQRHRENNQTCYVSEAAEAERLRMELGEIKADIEAGRLVRLGCPADCRHKEPYTCQSDYVDLICVSCYRDKHDIYDERAALEGGPQ